MHATLYRIYETGNRMDETKYIMQKLLQNAQSSAQNGINIETDTMHETHYIICETRHKSPATQCSRVTEADIVNEIVCYSLEVSGDVLYHVYTYFRWVSWHCIWYMTCCDDMHGGIRPIDTL
jgi:hypothetical protein